MILSIIIVNYKTPQLVLQCIKSIYNTFTEKDTYEIIVVDNNSQDDSEQAVTAIFKKIIWINKNENDGFGRANNIGIKASKGDCILLLNSDIIVCENTINECLLEIKSKKHIGALGCLLVNENGTFQKSTYEIASLRSLLDNNLFFNYFIKAKEAKKEAIMGSFMLIPKSVFEECGLFDPDFFMYSEELELCFRISKNGYEIKYFDKVKAIHKHQGSQIDKNWNIKQRYLSNALLYYKTRGLFIYFLYHIIFILNIVSNFFAMWFLDSNYRKDFYFASKGYFSSMFYYFVIPFIYSRKIGNGKKLLR